MKLLAGVIALMALAACDVAQAQQRPLSKGPRGELGVGVVALTVPDYRGSDRYQLQLYPVPYAVYRSQNVQLSREGLRARLFSFDRVNASFSGNLNLTGRGDNPDRAGMPQLSPTIEFGPSLDYRAAAGRFGDTGTWMVRGRAPLRGAIAVDDFRWVGAVFAPHLRIDADQDLAGDTELYYVMTAGPLWASSEYHDYYYGVDDAYQAPGRPAYEAHSGSSGFRSTASVTLRLGRFRVGLFATDDQLGDAAFAESPLVKTTHNLAGGIFMTVRLYSHGGALSRDDDAAN